MTEGRIPQGMKRVLFVDHVNRILGGAEINLLDLLPALLAGKQWEPAVACFEGSILSDATGQLEVAQFNYGFAKSLNEARFAQRDFSVLTGVRGMMAFPEARQRLHEIVAAFRPHAVISCTNKDHFCAGPVCKRYLIPSIWWVNDILSPDFFSWPVRATFRSQARRYASRLVTVSNYARRALEKEGMPANLMQVIHNGVSLEKLRIHPSSVLREMCGLPANEPLIGIIGRFTPWKGQAFFLKLAEAWTREHPAGHFVLIGQSFNEDQAYEESLRRYVQEHKLNGRVHFVPFQSNIASVLQEMTVIVHASNRPEPFGRVLIEAMAMGVSVIAARAGGVPEIITHGVNGLLAEPENLAEYLNCLRQLMSSEKQRADFAAAGRKTVEEQFTLERVWRQFDEILSAAT